MASGKDGKAEDGGRTAAAERRERLAEELRANLKKRKTRKRMTRGGTSNAKKPE